MGERYYVGTGRRMIMSEPTIELLYFDGCPNAESARENLASVLGSGSWVEWNLAGEDTPEYFRRFGSPTVLVDGRDVTGEVGGSAAMACRADGAPSVDMIRRAVSSRRDAHPRVVRGWSAASLLDAERGDR
jgi:mercuric ion transport protein